MKNTWRRSAPAVLVSAATPPDLRSATSESRHTRAEYSVLPEPMGPITRMRRPPRGNRSG